MIEVAGALREYAWGRHDGLAEWTVVTDGPQAASGSSKSQARRATAPL